MAQNMWVHIKAMGIRSAAGNFRISFLISIVQMTWSQWFPYFRKRALQSILVKFKSLVRLHRKAKRWVEATSFRRRDYETNWSQIPIVYKWA